MKTKLFDTYGIIGLLFSILLALFSIYKEISSLYIIIGVLLIAIFGIVMVLLNKFTEVDSYMLKISDNLKQNNEEIIDLNNRFKTIEDLNDIRLDIRELKREVFIK